MHNLNIHYDTSVPPLDLLRTRKRDETDIQTGIMTIGLDLRCCGLTYPSTSAVNRHYIKKHTAYLPRSDPATWSHVIIKDPAAHSSLGLSLPYIPFPSQQPRQSTWTIRVSARTPGSAQERAHRRTASKKRSCASQQQMLLSKGEITRLEGELQEAQRAKSEAQERIFELEDSVFRQLRIIKDLRAQPESTGSYSDLQAKYLEEKKANASKWQKLTSATKELKRIEVERDLVVKRLTSERDLALVRKEEYKKSYIRQREAQKTSHRENATAHLRLDLMMGTNKALSRRLTIVEDERNSLAEEITALRTQESSK